LSRTGPIPVDGEALAVKVGLLPSAQSSRSSCRRPGWSPDRSISRSGPP